VAEAGQALFELTLALGYGLFALLHLAGNLLQRCLQFLDAAGEAVQLALEDLLVLLVLSREVDVEIVDGLLDRGSVHLQVLLQQFVGLVEFAPLLLQDLLEEVHVAQQLLPLRLVVVGLLLRWLGGVVPL